MLSVLGKAVVEVALSLLAIQPAPSAEVKYRLYEYSALYSTYALLSLFALPFFFFIPFCCRGLIIDRITLGPLAERKLRGKGIFKTLTPGEVSVNAQRVGL